MKLLVIYEKNLTPSLEVLFSCLLLAASKQPQTYTLHSNIPVRPLAALQCEFWESYIVLKEDFGHHFLEGGLFTEVHKHMCICDDYAHL